MTAEGARGRLVSEATAYRLVRMARVLGWARTPVPRGYVLTLPSGGLLAVLREERQSISDSLASGPRAKAWSGQV